MDHLTIIKVGGKVLEDPVAAEQFLSAFERIKGLKVLVHGGGVTASKLQQELGQDAVLIDGRRITDEQALKAVTMVYAGLINKQVVARLNAGGFLKAVGITGVDGAFITAHQRPVGEIDYGFVGDIDDVDLGFLHTLLTHFFTPVVAPITATDNGQLLNTNADTIAQEIAIAAARKYETVLMYCFDLPGVMLNVDDPKSVIPYITPESYTKLKHDGKVAGGMIPKLDNAFKALEAGVFAVRICQAADIVTQGGTTVMMG